MQWLLYAKSIGCDARRDDSLETRSFPRRKRRALPSHNGMHATSLRKPVAKARILGSDLPGGCSMHITMNRLPPVVWVLLAALTAAGQQAPTAPMILKGTTMGAVTFSHSAHLRVAAKCEICHHASKPQKPPKSPQEACTDCHTKPATAPVNTTLQAAFHNSAANAGLCVTCHKTENAEGKAAPIKCADCHKKESQ